MNSVSSKPSAPPFNDSLYQALSPLDKVLSDRQRIEQIMKKYGSQVPTYTVPKPPPIQWEGDNHA